MFRRLHNERAWSLVNAAQAITVPRTTSLRAENGLLRLEASAHGRGIRSRTVCRGLRRIKYYNNVLFHKVERNFIVQTGDPTGTGKGGSSINGCALRSGHANAASAQLQRCTYYSSMRDICTGAIQVRAAVARRSRRCHSVVPQPQ